MDPDRALTYGIVLSVLSVILLWLASNALAAAILAFSIFFYAVIYTIWLKTAHAAKYRHWRGGRGIFRP